MHLPFRQTCPLFALALLSAPAFAEVSLFDASAGLDLAPCEQSSLSCTTLTLPLDHLANDPGKTIDITFALSFASVESRGILFYFVGGPGASGLASAESYLASFDANLTQYIDVVFVDQRGTGATHGLACPVAQAVFDAAPAKLSEPEKAIETARTYVADCTAEMGRDDILAFVNSDQAIRDAEAFRQAIGAPKVWLYGESYGTQFAQGYAAQIPAAVRGVILDGVVDLNLDAEGFYSRYTTAAERILAQTFADCTTIASCHADMGGDAAQVYDTLAAQLSEAPIQVAFPLADGTLTKRPLTLGLLEANAFYALYSPEGRASFLRVLAASARGNLVPMLQLGYSNTYIDPATEMGIEDSGWFSAAYYAITCTDYDSGPGTPDQRAAAIMAEAAAFAPNAPRLLRSYYLERLACAFWPHQGPATRPSPFAGGDWPTLILNGEADPITPVTMSYSVLDSARNAYGVFLKGGPHVIWGRGIACPDDIVYDLLIDGIRPQAREQACEQDFMADYIPLTLTDPVQFSSPVAIARAMDAELYQIIPLGDWDGADPMTVGCDFGGTLTVAATASGTDYAFDDCRLWHDLSISGAGVEVKTGEDEDSMTLTLAASGKHSGDIVYRYSHRDEAWSISGTWDGQPAVLPRVAP
jgi:pimeloyl-ACP methyl ester carboxylesterase